MPQSTVNTAPATKAAGQLADNGPSRTEAGFASAALAFGRIVAWATGTSDRTLKLPAAATDVTAQVAGVVRQQVAKEADATGYAEKEDVPVLKQGVIYVTSETATTKGGSVHVRYAGTGNKGEVRNAAVASETDVLPGARFEETISAAGVVAISINLP